MDDRRFDAIVKSLAEGKSRRTVLKGILGLGGAALAGGALLEGDTDAARRPTNPTPTPVKCPGQQVVCGNTCCCPTGQSKCGPDCCHTTDVPLHSPGYSECCDNACCFGTCYGEELCCPTNNRSGGDLPIPPTHRVCDTVNGKECCPFDDECCIVDGCCDTVCFGGSVGADSCCTEEDFCPGGSESEDLCCTGNTTCCGRGTNGNACLDLTDENVCCTEADCEDPCEVCNPRSHTCEARCDEGEVCCTLQAGPGRCQEGTCCPGAPCPVAGQLCCVDDEVATCVTTGECCTVDSDCDNGCLSCVGGACIPQCTRQECCTVAENRADWFCREEGQCCVVSDCGVVLPPGCEVECDSETHLCRALICLEGQICCHDDAGIGTCTAGSECPCTNDDDCATCETCNDSGECVPAADGSACAQLVDDDDADDGICCSGQCLDEDQVCNGGTCCPGGFCDGTGTCCPSPNVGCNGGVCCDGFCDGNGDCCPEPNVGCNGGVCCNVACDPEGNCPPACEPNCNCGDGVVDPATDGLDCNGGIEAGGGVCACGWCVVPLEGCPCGCDGDTECIQCEGGECVTYNQGGSCNGGDGFCNGAYCDSCLGIGGACSGDGQCCSGLCDQGACVTCKNTGGTCDSAGDCCSPNICFNGFCVVQ